MNSDLTEQLDKLLVPDLGITSNASSSIAVPQGSGICDVYVMKNPNEVFTNYYKRKYLKHVEYL